MRDKSVDGDRSGFTLLVIVTAAAGKVIGEVVALRSGSAGGAWT